MGQDDPSGEVRTGAARPSHGPDPVTEADGTPVQTPAAAGTDTSTVGAPTDGSSDVVGSAELDEPTEVVDVDGTGVSEPEGTETADHPSEPAPVVESIVDDAAMDDTDLAPSDDDTAQAAPAAEEPSEPVAVARPAGPVAVDEPAGEPSDVTLLIKGGHPLIHFQWIKMSPTISMYGRVVV